MSTIDERIVKMQFDNSQFESRVKTTINTLANLKTALNIGTLASSFKSATSTIISQVTSMGHTLERVAASSVSGIKTLSSKVTNLGYTVKNMGTTITNAIPTSALTGMAENVESISSKFSALGTIGITALQNITNKAVDAGEKILSALTIDPLKSGFQEYETQINAVQTILANTESKGTTLEDVNNALDELNKYADQTIYNFTEMTRNIGTFTAAGVDLDTSVTAIKGIANLAAESGSTSQQASTAMYQLSQALASGTVKLQDWNSVVNAGMGGQLFQDALKETARNSGVAIDDLIEKYGSFRETLSSGWLTTDILTETLEHFANDQTAIDAATKVKTFTQLFDTLGEAMQSGWTQTWEILIGDFEEAKEFLTYLSDTFSELINASSDARNNFLESWSELGGRESLIQSAKNIIDAFLNTLNNVKKALSNIIPNVTAEQVYNITEKFREFTENLKTLSEGDFSTFTEGSQIFSKFSDIISQIVKSLRQLANSLKGSVTTAIEQVKKIFEKLISTASKLKTLLSGTFSTAVEQVKKIFEKLTPTVQKLKSLFTGTFSKAIEALSPIVDTAIEEFTKLKDVLGDKLPDIIETLFSVFGSVTDKASEFNDIFLESLGNGLSSLIRKISGFISEFVELGGVSSILEIIGNVAKSAFKIFELFIESLGEAFGGMDTSAKPLYNIVERIRELTENFLNSESAGEKVKKIFKGIFSIGSIVVSVIKQIAEVLTGSFGGSVLDAAASIAGLVTQLAQTIKSSNVVKNVLNTVISVMSTVVSVVTSLISIAISEGPRIISVIISIVNAVVKFVNQFAALGGFSEIGQIINNAFSVILKAANSISSAFKEVFPSFGTGANAVYAIVVKIRQLVSAVNSSSTVFQSIKDIFTAVFKAISLVSSALSSLTSNTNLVNNGASFLTSSLGSLVEVAKWLQTVIGKVSSVFGKFFDEFNALGGTQKAIDGFTGAITFLGKVISAVKDAFKEVFTTIDTDANPLYTLVSGFKDLIDKCNSSTKVISNVKRIAKGLFAAIDIGIQAFTTIGNIIGSAFTGSLETTTPTLELVAEKISDIVAAIADVVVEIDNMIKKVGGFETIQSIVTSFIQKFKMAIETVGETISTTFNNIKSVIKPVFVGLLGLLHTTQTASNIATIFRSIGTALKTAFENLPTTIENVKTVLVGMITTLDEVAGYLWDTFSPILDSIVRLWNGALSHFGITLDNAGEKIVKSGFIVSLILLIKAIKDVIDTGKEVKSVATSVKGTFDSISGYFKNKNKTTILQIAGSVLMFAGAISLVAFSLIELSQVPWDNMKTGLIGLVACVAMLGVILLAVSALMKREKNTNGFFEGEGYSDTKYNTTGIYQLALSLLMIGVAIRMCAKVVESLGDLNTEELIQGIAGLWGIVSILELYIIALSEASKNMQSGTVLQIVAGILLMSSAIAALRLFATMSVDEISDALFGFAATIATFMVVLYALQEVPNTTQVAASILILSGAMIVMGAAMKIMSTLMWEDVAIGLTVVAGVLLLFGAAAAILNKLGAVSAMIALAGALILFNASIVVLAAGIISLGLAFEFICGIIASLNGIGQSVIDGFAYLGPIIAGLCDTIVQTAPNMSAAATALIISFCQAIIASTPWIVAAFAAVITGICASADTLLIQPIVALLETLSIAIREVVNRLVDDIFIILTNFVDLLFEFITVVAGDLIVLVVAVIEKLADAIVEVVPYLVQSGIALITGIILGIAEEIPSLIAAGYILIISFIDGLADSIETYQPQLNAAIDRLLDAIKEHIIDGTPIGAIVDFVGNIKDSFVEEFNNIKDNITGAVDNAVSGIKNFFGLGSSDDAEEAGKESAAGYANGIKEGQKDAEEAAESLGESTVDSLRKKLKVASPSKEFAEVGEYSAEGYTEGIESGQDDAEEAASDLGNNALSTLLETFGLSSLADGFDLSSFTDGFDLSSITDSLGDGFDLSSITDSLGEGFDLSSITDGFDTSSITDNIDLSSITDGFDLSSFTDGINLDTSGLTDSMSDIDWSAYTDKSTITTAITPVIDDSEIQNGKYDAMENVTISTEGSTESITKAANTLNTDNSTYSQKIVDAVESVGDSVESGVSLSRTINNTISKITERISDLEDAITKMQVVLDTGTLVGELSSSVDATLGTTTAMKARGV